MRSVVIGLLCFATFGEARATTCTYNDGWDTAPSDASDEIVIASGSLTWDDTLPAKVASWSQTGGTVTFKKAFDTPLEVAGAVTLSGGTWTHAVNDSAKLGSTDNKYRVYVKCGGDMTIGAEAVIVVDGLGYRSHQSLPDKAESGTQGGSYGGHGGMATATFNSTYGSLFAPEELGNSGGGWSGPVYGGGCIRLDVGGKLTLQGAINANGTAATTSNIYYSGAGGSIFIHAGSIEGTGTLMANSGVSLIGGGGGRIAVILTGAEADFTNYDIYSLATAHSGKAEARQGGCGTIYAETPADGANHGWLILKGNGYDPSGADVSSEWYYADPFSANLTSANFSKITIAGKTKFYLREGYTLDMAGTVLDCREAGYGLRVKGGTLKVKDGGPMTLTGVLEFPAEYSLTTSSLTISDGGTLSIHEKLTVSGNVVVANGGKVTTKGASVTPGKAHLAVGGNLTIDAGGTIDVVGCGYSIDKYPGGSIGDSSGGSHGGWGIRASGAVENCVSPYGSVVDPVTAGSGGGQSFSVNSEAGGGVVILDVTGALTVNGSILANGNDKNHYAGAGGSINITAASIVGTADAVITANAGLASVGTSAAGGGRIAIKLTGVGQGFDGYQGTLTAYGYRKAAKSDTTKRGGAGTIYLQTAAQGENGGTLIVDNGEATSSGKTLLGGTATGTTFGSVVIRGKAQLALADGETLTVKGDFDNQATFVAGAGASVVFAGSGASTVSGNTTFVNLGCTMPGKEIRFAAGSTQKVTGSLNVVSDGEKIRLVSTVIDSAWNLDTTGASAELSGLEIGDCHSTVPITAKESEDLGGNSDTVTVIGKIEAKTFTWTGEAGDGAWGTVGNWDDGTRAPLDKDTVIIPADTATMPTIIADTTVAALTVAGSLDFGTKTLTVTGPIVATGSLSVQPGARLLVGGDLSLATVTPRTLALVLNGTVRQTAAFTASSLLSVEALNPSVSFAGDFFCETLTLGNAADTCDYAFADGTAVEAILAYVNGGLSQPNVTLRPAEAGKTWAFMTKASSVVGAIVSGSDARGGAAVIPQASTDANGNFNWDFADTRLRWNGQAGNGDFADAGNWDGGLAPTKDDAVVIEGDFAVEIGAETEVAGLSVGLKAKVTVNAPLTVGGSVSLTPFGTLVANKPISVAGDFDVLSWATLTHDSNTKTATNRIDIAVSGNGTFAAEATVDVAGKGYKRGGGCNGLGGSSSGDPPYAASYGGRGYYGATASRACYGSIVNPTDVGSVGGWDGDGGGAIILSFGGSLSIDCTFCANGGKATRDGQYRDYYGSSGGSINLTAATLSGKGTLQANGGWINGGNRAGGGGRIAVRLTDPEASFEGCGVKMETFGGPSTVKTAGSAGTIFTKTATEAYGTLTIAKSTNATHDAAQERTDFPKTQDNDPKEVKNVNVRLGTKATLNLTDDATVSSLVFDSNDARILLNGHKLYILGTAKRSVKEFVRARATPGEDADGNPGEIIWQSGFTLLVR